MVSEQIKPFHSDGCTFYPDENYHECCVNHDKKYWKGGTKEERKEADKELLKCVSKRSGKINASVMHIAVRIFGHPLIPTSARWGFGFKYPRNYGT